MATSFTPEYPCYNPDGSQQTETSNASDGIHQVTLPASEDPYLFGPAYTPWQYEPTKCQGDTQACCYGIDACMSGGWCFQLWTAQMYRGGCADPKWGPDSGCATQCLSGKMSSVSSLHSCV